MSTEVQSANHDSTTAWVSPPVDLPEQGATCMDAGRGKDARPPGPAGIGPHRTGRHPKTPGTLCFSAQLFGDALKIRNKYGTYRNDEILIAGLLAMEILPDRTRALCLHEACQEARANAPSGKRDAQSEEDLPIVAGIRKAATSDDVSPDDDDIGPVAFT